nr:NlpC/P60 family protein [Arthrobacter jiangjiafuii]
MGRQAAVVVAASGLVLAAGLPAQAAVSTDRQALDATPLSLTAAAPVSVPADAKFDLRIQAVTLDSNAEQRAQIAAEEAAAVEAEAAAVVAAQAEQAAAVTVAQSAPTAATSAPAASTAAVAAPAADVSASGYGAALVAAAYGQLGVAQDCTAMVEKALRSIGKSVGDLAPGQFFAYGSVVGSPQPGDLVITGGHVAIYVGNGQVISGGLNGMNTGLHSLSDLPGASFVRVN